MRDSTAVFHCVKTRVVSGFGPASQGSASYRSKTQKGEAKERGISRARSESLEWPFLKAWRPKLPQSGNFGIRQRKLCNEHLSNVFQTFSSSLSPTYQLRQTWLCADYLTLRYYTTFLGFTWYIIAYRSGRIGVLLQGFSQLLDCSWCAIKFSLFIWTIGFILVTSRCKISESRKIHLESFMFLQINIGVLRHKGEICQML